MSIRVMLVDDEPLARLGVRARLKTRPGFEVVAEASSGKEALQICSEVRPDALFLDIEMVSSSGLDVARLLNGSLKPVIVFLTAHRHYALQAFDVQAADYLVKPINESRFEISLARMREQVLARRQARAEIHPFPSSSTPDSGSPVSSRVAVVDRKRTRFVETADIDWVSAAGDYTELHVGQMTYLLREPLTALTGRLPSPLFCRIHRSFVVNLTRVSEFITLRNQDFLVKLKDGTRLRASRTFSDEFRKALVQR